jgi:hypothetical protein
MPRLPHARQFTNRKAMSKKSGYTWHLTAEEFESFAMQPCTDCATTPCKGVYRRDVSTEGPFSVDNCLPLCADCGRRYGRFFGEGEWNGTASEEFKESLRLEARLSLIPRYFCVSPDAPSDHGSNENHRPCKPLCPHRTNCSACWPKPPPLDSLPSCFVLSR